MLANKQQTTNQHWCYLKLLCASVIVISFSHDVLAQSAVSKCSTGDASCFCKAVGGQWIATPTTIRPTCRKAIPHQGRQRIVDFYFPAGIKASGKSYTPWIFLHGVHTAEWHLDSNPVWRQLRSRWPIPLGGNAQAHNLGVLTGTEITDDHSNNGSRVGGLVKDGNYVLVVPEATGKPEEGQIWNSLYWSCMDAVPKKCVDKSIDDVGFIAHVIHNLAGLLPGIQLNRNQALSGYSNGGMTVQALLCKQPGIAEKLASVSILASTLGADFAKNECKGKLAKAVPFMWLHGTTDDTLPYKHGWSEGVAVMGVEAAVEHWATRMGCSSSAIANPSTIFTDKARAVVCKDYCNQAQQQQQQKVEPVVLCTAASQPHQLLRTMPGYPAALIRWATPDSGSGMAFSGPPQLF